MNNYYTTLKEMTIHEHAQHALSSLLSSHPDGSSSELSGVLERLDPDSSDAKIIQSAIERLDELAEEISRVEYMLAEAEFSFGKLEL